MLHVYGQTKLTLPTFAFDVQCDLNNSKHSRQLQPTTTTTGKQITKKKKTRENWKIFALPDLSAYEKHMKRGCRGVCVCVCL